MELVETIEERKLEKEREQLGAQQTFILVILVMKGSSTFKLLQNFDNGR